MSKQVQMFHHGLASCKLTIEDGRGKLTEVYSRARSRGDGTGLLTQVINFADNFDLELYLTARIYGSYVQTMLDPMQLRRFYEKFGFVVVTDLYPAADMVRIRIKNTPYSERENTNLSSSLPPSSAFS